MEAPIVTPDFRVEAAPPSCDTVSHDMAGIAGTPVTSGLTGVLMKGPPMAFFS